MVKNAVKSFVDDSAKLKVPSKWKNVAGEAGKKMKISKKPPVNSKDIPLKSAVKKADPKIEARADELVDMISEKASAIEESVPKVSARTSQYMNKKYKGYQDSIKDLVDADGKLIEGGEEILQRMTRSSDEIMENHAGKIKGEKDIESFMEKRREDFVSNPTIMDSAFAHKVPQLAGGGLGTAWLVQNMSDNRGRQSNSQLYNQR